MSVNEIESSVNWLILIGLSVQATSVKYIKAVCFYVGDYTVIMVYRKESLNFMLRTPKCLG